MKRDISWSINNTTYTIRNVPYDVCDNDGEEVIDLGVAIKLEMLRELMLTNEIEKTEVDYDLFADIEFGH